MSLRRSRSWDSKTNRRTVECTGRYWNANSIVDKNWFCRMFFIVARLSLHARTTPRRSPSTSITPALSIATSVQVPIAIPTSACARAGASFTPSPSPRQLVPSCDCHRSTQRPGSLLRARNESLRLSGFDRICNADESGGRSVHRNEHHGLPQLAESFRFGEQRSGIQAEFSLMWRCRWPLDDRRWQRVTPFPDSNVAAPASVRPRSLAPRTRASANRCSLACSRLAVRRRNSPSRRPPVERTVP